MSTLSTASLNWLAKEWEKSYKTAVLSGIVGDLAHKARGGYHISREDQGKSNYSVTRPDDKPGNGPSDRAAAIDMTMGTADIIKCHTRLRESWKNRAKDSRWKYINAWNGWDGQGSAGRYDVVTGNVGTATADHKWHIHLEIRRKYVNDMNAMKAILSLLKGEPAVKPTTPAPAPKPAPTIPKPTTPPVVAKPTPPVVAPKPPVIGGKDMTKEEMLALLKSAEGQAAIQNAVINTNVGSKAHKGRSIRDFFNDMWGIRDYLVNDGSGSVVELSKVTPETRLAKLAALADVDQFAAVVASKLPAGVTAEQVAAAVRAALTQGPTNI
jgi:hypothetical protein